MNLLILEPHEFSESLFRLKGRKKEHICKIWKAKVGDTFQAGILNQSYGTIRIIEIRNDEILVEYTVARLAQEPTLKIHLFSSFQRPQTIKKILQLSAVCGVKKISFFPFEKSEKAYETSSLLNEEEIKKELILGLEQGKRVEMPIVNWSFVLKEKLQLEFPSLTFLLDLEGKKIFHYASLLQAKKELDIGIILGPESGLSKKDREFFLSKKALLLKLSQNVLRSEFALAYALSQLELITEDFS